MTRILLLSFIIGLTTLHSEAQMGDFMGRIGIQGKCKLTKKLSVDVGVQSRMNFSTKTYSSTNFSLEGAYRLSKSIKVGLAYRNLIQPNEYPLLDNKAMAYRNRFQADLRFLPSRWLKLDKYISLEFRTLFQYEHFKFQRNQVYWRNRFLLKPVIKNEQIQPYASAELLYRFNQEAYFVGDELVTQGLMNELRYTVGIEYNVNKNNAIDVGFMFRDFRTSKPTNVVLLVTYVHDFNQLFPAKK